ncbi:MAG: 50S ribosomal protein L7/L12 [Candidatus Gracilibacteria bacterium]|nr:50S ribosomal protein L7/L12 [Candidatus Gracilibacteria bacterium]
MAELSGNSKKIMDLVKELSIVELNDLVKAMEEEFGVSAAAPVMVAAAAGAGEAEEKSSFDVVLKSVGANKIAVIKVIRELTGLGLIEAKAIADNGGDIKKGVAKADAEEMKAKLVEQGAEIELK